MTLSLAETKRKSKFFLNRGAYDLGMDEMTLHRKKKLRELIDLPPFNGSNLAFSRAIEKTKGRVTQMLDPAESFGENAARSICDAIGLPPRYFEQDFSPSLPASTAIDPDSGKRASTHVQTLEAMRDQIAILPEPVRDVIGKLVASYITAPSSEAGAEVLKTIEKLFPHDSKP